MNHRVKQTISVTPNKIKVKQVQQVHVTSLRDENFIVLDQKQKHIKIFLLPKAI